MSSVSPPCFVGPLLLSSIFTSLQSHMLWTPKARKVQEKICYHQSLMQIRRTSRREQLSLLNITEHNQNPWMQILFSSPLNKKELAFQEGSIDAGVSKALAHVCRLMMKVRKEAVTEGDYSLFGKVVTMAFSNSSALQKYGNLPVQQGKKTKLASSHFPQLDDWSVLFVSAFSWTVCGVMFPEGNNCCYQRYRFYHWLDAQILGHRGSQIHGSGCRTFSTASPDSFTYVAWSVNR